MHALQHAWPSTRRTIATITHHIQTGGRNPPKRQPPMVMQETNPGTHNQHLFFLQSCWWPWGLWRAAAATRPVCRNPIPRVELPAPRHQRVAHGAWREIARPRGSRVQRVTSPQRVTGLAGNPIPRTRAAGAKSPTRGACGHGEKSPARMGAACTTTGHQRAARNGFGGKPHPAYVRETPAPRCQRVAHAGMAGNRRPAWEPRTETLARNA